MRILNIPLTQGRADKIDAKFAPLGVLATAKNLRVRKDGRLASRTGYQLQSATTDHLLASALVAYDLHEYQGRLVALGSDFGDGFPTSPYELVGTADEPWRGAAPARQVVLSPFTNLRGCPVVPQLSLGGLTGDVAAGGGYVGVLHQLNLQTFVYFTVTRQSDGQIIHQDRAALSAAGIVRATYAGGTFYIMVAQTTGTIIILSYTPGVHGASVQSFATVVTGGTAVLAMDMVPVTNGSTTRIIVTYTKAANTQILKYSSAGAQVGSNITVALASVDSVTIEADETDNTINIYTIVATVATLRTYNFTTDALTLGPTACTAAATGSMCRLPVLGANVQAIAVAGNTSAGNVSIQIMNQSAHTVLTTITVGAAALTGRICEGQSGSANRCVVFSGLVAPAWPTATFASDALFYVGSTQAHMFTRNRLKALNKTQHNLQLDTSTGKLCWLGWADITGDGLAQPSVATVDFRSTNRRQAARYGGFLYLAGAPVQAYDGSLSAELNFVETPGIISATPAAGGSLTASAEYDYVHHWEFTRPDGTFERSAISAVFAGNTGGAQTQNTMVLSSPHSIRVALGFSLFGGGVISVLSRTVWDAANGTKGSQFRRCVATPVGGTMSGYGATTTVVDTISDAVLATKGVVYTQGTRNALSGPVEDNAPFSCSYITADASRLFTGGLERPYETQVSKPPNIEQTQSFSDLTPFFNLVSEEIKGVASLDGLKLVFTKNQIFALGREGPDDQGGGALDPPQELPTPSGLKDWRSLLLAHDGQWFQLDDRKLYKMPRGGGAPEWMGIDIQDTLTSYPTVTGACRCKLDDAIAFSCENTGSSDARIVVRSLRTGLWTEDTPPLQASQGIEALSSYGETLAYISGGRVYVQSPTLYADSASTVIVTQSKTHPIYPFELGGCGTIHELLLTGEYRSAGTLALRVSYDDGVNFTAYDSFILTDLLFAVGQTVQRKWSIQQSDITSAVFELTYTPAAAGEGFVAHSLALQVDQSAGRLKDLNPSEIA